MYYLYRYYTILYIRKKNQNNIIKTKYFHSNYLFGYTYNLYLIPITYIIPFRFYVFILGFQLFRFGITDKTDIGIYLLIVIIYNDETIKKKKEVYFNFY